jgi:hypothetical protein
MIAKSLGPTRTEIMIRRATPVTSSPALILCPVKAKADVCIPKMLNRD